MAYTDAQVTELKAITDLDYAKATVFAEKHGLSPRSVVAKARALDLPYKTKAPGTKAKSTKAPVERKSDVAKDISDLLDISLASLDKMTGADLLALRARVNEIVGA